MLEVVQFDVCGPMHTAPFSGKRYYVMFIDYKSRFCAAYLLQSKSEVLDKFMQFDNFAQTQIGHCIKVLRSDTSG